MNLILFGFKSCGKTTLGQLLAYRLHRPFLDTDRLLEQRYLHKTGISLKTRAIHKKIGEEAFRALESELLHQLEKEKSAIIALGGGFILNPHNATFLAKLGQLVYLKLDKETLKKRMLRREPPTFLDSSDPEGSFEQMYNTRKKIYEEIPAVQLDLEHKTQAQNIQEICVLIQKLESSNG
jgi:shikimate kinase